MKLEKFFIRYPALTACEGDILNAFKLLVKTYKQGGKLLVCGNGGSAADSEHIVGELMKSFIITRKIPNDICVKLQQFENGKYIASYLQGGLPAISLVSQSGLNSAIGNDIAADMAFAQQVYVYAKPEDCFLGISTSGNAKNVLHAAQVAKAMGMKTLSLTGQMGGFLGNICDVSIKAPAVKTYEVQEFHIPIYHQLCMMVEDEFFNKFKNGGI